MWQILSAVFAFLTLGAGSALVIVANRQSTAVSTLQKDNQALNGLLKTRDTVLADTKRDLEIVTGEHKQLMQVNHTRMIEGWLKFEASVMFQENQRLRAVMDACPVCELSKFPLPKGT